MDRLLGEDLKLAQIDEKAIQGALSDLREARTTPRYADLITAARKHQHPITQKITQPPEMTLEERNNGRAMSAALAGQRAARRGDLDQARKQLARAIQHRDTVTSPPQPVLDAITQLQERTR